MGKKKTSKKSSAVDTPVKSELMTPKEAKNTQVEAALHSLKMKKEPSSKEAISSPKGVLLTPKTEAAFQTSKSHEVKKRAVQKKLKSTPEVAHKTFKNGTPSIKKSKKTKTPKEEPVQDVRMALEGEEEEAAESPVRVKPSAKKTASVESAPPKKAGKFCLFVRGLHYESEQDNVFKHFKQFGTVKRCSIPRNPTKSSQIKGFGFVEYNSQEAMDKALAAAHTLDGRTLQVTKNNDDKEVSVKRKRDESQQPGGDTKRHRPKFDHEFFVAKLKNSTTTDSIQKHFSQFGEVVNVSMPMKDKTNNKGYAFVAFREASSIKKALSKSNQQIDLTTIVLDAGKKPAAKEAPPKPFPSFPNELFIGGLNISTNNTTLEKHFSKYGKVVNVTLPWVKKLGRNKGFGFVSFESAASLKEALEEDHEIDGKQVAVQAGKKAEEKCAASQKTKSKEPKVASAVRKMEDDSEEDEQEDGDEVEGVEGDEGDSDDDEEVEGDSDEAGDEADEEEEEEEEDDGDDDAVENGDEEDGSDEDGDNGDNDDNGDDDDDDDSDE